MTEVARDGDGSVYLSINLFHRAVARIERELDDNEQAQDGSEIRSVEFERLTAEGQTFIGRRNSMEFFRDQAADQFERRTHSAGRPRSGSTVNHRTFSSAMIDSRDFLAAKRRAENEVLLPAGPKIAVTGGLDFNDHRLVWDRLDKVHAKHPDMVLLHGDSPKGAERIAARWTDHRKVPQIAFKPDWTKHAKEVPFKRNDQMLEVLPIGVMVCIQDNLADKARKLGIRSSVKPGRRFFPKPLFSSARLQRSEFDTDPYRIFAAAARRLRLYSALRRGGGGRRDRSPSTHFPSLQGYPLA
jgi:YspA, cpYpsA-related SLOG family